MPLLPQISEMAPYLVMKGRSPGIDGFAKGVFVERVDLVKLRINLRQATLTPEGKEDFEKRKFPPPHILNLFKHSTTTKA